MVLLGEVRSNRNKKLSGFMEAKNLSPSVTRSNTCNCTGSYLNKGWAASTGRAPRVHNTDKNKDETKGRHFYN